MLVMVLLRLHCKTIIFKLKSIVIYYNVLNTVYFRTQTTFHFSSSLSLCVAEVTHLLWCESSRVQFQVPARVFMFAFLFCVLFHLLSKNTLFVTQFCNSFCNVNLFSIFIILQDLWPIISLSRYRPSICKICQSLCVS